MVAVVLAMMTTASDIDATLDCHSLLELLLVLFIARFLLLPSPSLLFVAKI